MRSFTICLALLGICLLSNRVSTQSLNCDCLPNQSNRIVGGQYAEPNEYPWQTSLGMKINDRLVAHLCGATILNAEWVMTAAHCALASKNGNLTDILWKNHSLNFSSCNLFDFQINQFQNFRSDSEATTYDTWKTKTESMWPKRSYIRSTIHGTAPVEVTLHCCVWSSLCRSITKPSRLVCIQMPACSTNRLKRTNAFPWSQPDGVRSRKRTVTFWPADYEVVRFSRIWKKPIFGLFVEMVRSNKIWK